MIKDSFPDVYTYISPSLNKLLGVPETCSKGPFCPPHRPSRCARKSGFWGFNTSPHEPPPNGPPGGSSDGPLGPPKVWIWHGTSLTCVSKMRISRGTSGNVGRFSTKGGRVDTCGLCCLHTPTLPAPSPQSTQPTLHPTRHGAVENTKTQEYPEKPIAGTGKHLSACEAHTCI